MSGFAGERESRAYGNRLALKQLDRDTIEEEDDEEGGEEKDDDLLAGHDEEAEAREARESMKHAIMQQPRFGLESNFWFLSTVAVIALINLQALALEADLKCYGNWCPGSGTIWMLLDNVFTIIFLLELVLRIIDEGASRYFWGQQEPGAHRFSFAVAHVIDVIIILLRALDVWFLSQAGFTNTGLKQISAFRVAHLGPCIKKLRLVRGFRELWLAIAAVAETSKTIMWVGVLLFLVIWVFSIVFTMLVGQDDPAGYDYTNYQWGLEDYWGTVLRSAFTLFQILTTDSWSAGPTLPVILKSNWLFIFYLAFNWISVMMLLNTITGAVVEATLESSKQNEEKAAKERQRLESKVMESLRQIFLEASRDGSGELNREDLHAALKKKRVRERMKMLEIPPKDLDLLFTLMDESGTGSIKTDMFFRGCSRLRGPAMASDLHHMSVDLERNLKWCNEHFALMTETNDKLSALLDHADTVDIDIVRGDADDKDPVLKARRARERISKGSFFRSTSNDKSSSNAHAASEWDVIIGRQASKSSKGSRKSLLQAGTPVSKTLTKAMTMKETASVSMPAPPPLPPHLAHLENKLVDKSPSKVTPAMANKRMSAAIEGPKPMWPH